MLSRSKTVLQTKQVRFLRIFVLDPVAKYSLNYAVLVFAEKAREHPDHRWAQQWKADPDHPERPYCGQADRRRHLRPSRWNQMRRCELTKIINSLM